MNERKSGKTVEQYLLEHMGDPKVLRGKNFSVYGMSPLISERGVTYQIVGFEEGTDGKGPTAQICFLDSKRQPRIERRSLDFLKQDTEVLY
ncbi:MAG: hypothetical protein ABIH49_00075 [archaeon]